MKLKKLKPLVLLLPLVLCGCIGDMFRAKVERQKVDVEYYHPDGRPKKFCRIVDNRPLEVEYTDKAGNTWTEKVKLGGFNASPPALPEKQNPADKAILDQYIK